MAFEKLNGLTRKLMYNDTVKDRYLNSIIEKLGIQNDAVAKAKAMEVYGGAIDQAAKNPLSFTKDIALGNDVNTSGIGTTLKLGWDKVKAHPFKTAGFGLLGGANVAGLLDNNKIAGQLIGAGAGTALPFAINAMSNTPVFGVPGKIMFGLGGGALGSLFDTLMANKEKQQQYGGY